MALLALPRPGHKMDPKTYCLEVRRIMRGSYTDKPDLQHFLRQVLDRDIDEWRRKSFDNFVIEIAVSKLEDSKPYIDQDGDLIGWYTYNFQLIGSEALGFDFEKPLSVQYGAGEIRVYFQKQFQKIDGYLECLNESLTSRQKKQQQQQKPNPAQQRLTWAKQAQWWNANGRVFAIMALPQELRELIYAFALEGSVEPYPRTSCRKLGGHVGSLIARQPDTRLFRTSRLIYEEASHMFFLHNAFLIEHYGVLRQVMKNQELADRVRKLELALDHSDFFRLFGVDKEGDQLVRVESHGDGLRGMKLSCLELCFAHPCQISKWRWLDGTCHTEVTTIILNAAWQFIKRHPVTLTGYVKQRQVAAFAEKNRLERTKVEAWNQQRVLYGLEIGTWEEYDDDQWLAESDSGFEGVRLDGEPEDKEAVSEAELEPEETLIMPGACMCRPSCTLATWTSEC